MIPKISFLKANNKALIIPIFLLNILIFIVDALIITLNLTISIAKNLFKTGKNAATKAYKSEFIYISIISLALFLLNLFAYRMDSAEYLFLDDIDNGVLIAFMITFGLIFVLGIVLHYVLRKKILNNKQFWIRRGISYFLTFILLFYLVCFAFHYILKDAKIFKELTNGFGKTVLLFILTLLFALPLGLLLSFGSMSKIQVIKKPVKLLIWVIRGTPLMLQILMISFLPMIFKTTNIKVAKFLGVDVVQLMFIYVVLAFVINYACYFSEIYRSGIQSIPKGQYEAGKVLGMKKSETFFKVVLPQVIKRIVPPMSNEIITLVKDTSLAQVLSVAELLTATKHVVNQYVILTPFIYAAVFYLVFNGLVTIILGNIEKRLGYYEV